MTEPDRDPRRRSPAPATVAGKRVVITGAGRGLGALLAHAFSHAGASRGARRPHRDATSRRSPRRCPARRLVLSGDVTDEDFNEAVADATVAEWGGVDVWICNAGISPIVGRTARRPTPSVWRQVLEVNLTGAFLGARAAARVMGDGGRLIFTGSVLGERPREGPGRLQRVEGRAGRPGQGPGARPGAGRHHRERRRARAGSTRRWPRGGRATPSSSAAITGHTAQGRWGAPTDLAGAYQFLASDASAFVTGTVLNVDGGYLLV